MKFDLLEAISLVSEYFGTSGEITVSVVPYGIAVTISAIKSGELLRYRFMMTDIELATSFQPAMNIRFNHAIHELQLAVQQRDQNQEEQHDL